MLAAADTASTSASVARLSMRNRRTAMLQLGAYNVRLRILVSSAIGILAGSFCWFLLAHFHQGAGDFNWAIWMARDLVSRHDPYARPTQYYPLPAGFFG